MAAWTFAAVYGRPLPPISAESFPPIRTWKGEKKVAVPPPELASPAVGFSYWNDRAVGTAVIVHVPLYSTTPTLAIVTTSPTDRPCGNEVLIVTVLPTCSRARHSKRHGAAARHGQTGGRVLILEGTRRRDGSHRPRAVVSRRRRRPQW